MQESNRQVRHGSIQQCSSLFNVYKWFRTLYACQRSHLHFTYFHKKSNMSKAKKTPPPTNNHDGKGFFALAGEAFSVLGEEIIEGKNKVVEVTAEKITAVKKAIKKIGHKKPVKAAKGRAKSPAKKKVAKATKKAVTPVKKSPAKKVAPAAKRAPAKVASKSAKAVKKVARKK